MTLDELKSRLGEELRPLVDKYGPAFLEMSKAEVVAWIDLVANGKAAEAWEAVLAKLPNAGLLDAWKRLDGDWALANREEAARRELARRAGMEILKVLLMVAVAAVGL